MIFPILKAVPIAQENDKVRLSGVESFISKDEAAITLVEIEPSSGNGFIDVTGTESDDYFLDWSYATEGTETATLRITTDGAPVTVTADIEIISAANDKLFATDSDLIRYEDDILHFLPAGFSTWNHTHRKVQTLILDWFNEQGYRNTDRTKVTKDEVVDRDEVRKWAECWALQLIFQDASNSVDDKFDEKSRLYESRAVDARRRAVISLDFNKDGEITEGESVAVQSVRLVRA